MSYRWSAGKVDSGDINFSEDLDDHTKIDFEIDQIKLVANNTEYLSVTTGSVNIAMSGVVGINGGSSGHSGLTVLENGRVGIGTDAPDYKLDVAGNIGINEHIYHNGNDDTRLSFPNNDQINLVAGGKSVLKFASNTITLNNGNNNFDTKVMADNGQVVLHVDAGTNRVGIGTTSPSTTLDVSGTTKSNFYTTTVTTQDLGSGTNSDLSTASGIVLLDADSINGIDMGGGMEVHSLTFPTPSTSGQKLTIIAKNANTNNTFIVPSGLISGSFSQLHDGSGISALSFVWISEGTHKAWYQV